MTYFLVEKDAAPIKAPLSYKAIAAPIYWEPMMGSGERIVGAVAAVGEDGQVTTVQALNPAALRALFQSQGTNAARILGWVCESMKAQLEAESQLDRLKAPLSGFQVGDPVEYIGDDMEDVTLQVKTLYAAFANAQTESEVVENSFPLRDSHSVQEEVIGHVKRIAGIRASDILTDGGQVQVQDGDRWHFLDIPVHTGSKVGAITSACYRTSDTVEKNLLRAHSSLTTMTARNGIAGGVFIASLPDVPGVSKQLLDQIDTCIDELAWRMRQASIDVHVRDNSEELAQDIIEFAGS